MPIVFFESENSENIQLRISRKYPIKVWLDGQLIFSNNEVIRYEWDGEIVNLELGAGEHELLIKYAIGSVYSGKRNGKSYWQNNSNWGSYSYLYNSNDLENDEVMGYYLYTYQSGLGVNSFFATNDR